MKDNQFGRKPQTSRPSVAERDIKGMAASAVAAAKAVHHQQIALMIKQSLTASVVEPCLSPLLWSESFGLRLDG